MPDCRIGFIGAGGVAARHARVLSMLPEATLISVTDSDSRRAQEFATAYGVRPVPDVRSLLDSGVNAVYVCVPPFAHGRIETAIAKAGFALFVEKPLGLNAKVAGKIARVVTDAGVVTAVGHHWRYSAAVRSAARLLAERPVRLVCGGWLDQVPPVPWWTRLDKSGGQIIEQAVHVLDLARTLVGEVKEVHAMASVRRPGVDIDRATAVSLRFEGGAVGTFAATCQLAWKHRAGLEVYADELALAITEDELIVRDTQGVRRQIVDPERAKAAVDRAFVEAVLGDRSSVLVPYEEALRTHRLACTVAASARLNRPIGMSHG